MGAGSTASGKYTRLNSSISSIGTNKYRMTVTLGTSSSSVWNADGVNVYAVIDGTSSFLGKSIISGGSCSPSSWTKDFTVTKNTSCYAKCSDAVDASLASFSNQTSADTATYTAPAPAPTAPTAPTSITVTGLYEEGESQKISWSGATGTITKYEVLHSVYDITKKAWSEWYGSGTTTGTSFTVGHGNIAAHNRTAIKYGVRAYNGTLASGIKASGVFEHYGIKYYNGGWKYGKIQYWNGSSWARAYVRRWTGSEWKIL